MRKSWDIFHTRIGEFALGELMETVGYLVVLDVEMVMVIAASSLSLSSRCLFL